MAAPISPEGDGNNYGATVVGVFHGRKYGCRNSDSPFFYASMAFPGILDFVNEQMGKTSHFSRSPKVCGSESLRKSEQKNSFSCRIIVQKFVEIWKSGLTESPQGPCFKMIC